MILPGVGKFFKKSRPILYIGARYKLFREVLCLSMHKFLFITFETIPMDIKGRKEYSPIDVGNKI